MTITHTPQRMAEIKHDDIIRSHREKPIAGSSFKRSQLAQANSIRSLSEMASHFETAAPAEPELPLTVKEAARFLGVSPQLVYLWTERKQIPHLRVMGRNIRFLQSDLSAFRARFRKEVENETE